MVSDKVIALLTYDTYLLKSIEIFLFKKSIIISLTKTFFMQRVFLLLVTFLTFIVNTSLAQDSATILTLNSDNSYTYEKVFNVSDKNKEDIFKAIKTWVIKNVKTQANTNFFDDTEKNSISTNPAFACSYGSVVDFKLNVEIKDGKYRLTANSFIWHRNDGNDKKLGDFSGLGMFKPAQKKVLRDANESFASIVSSIESAVKQSSEW